MTPVENQVRQALGDQADVERIADDGRILRIWFRFIRDPVVATQRIAQLQTDLAALGARRRIESYLRLL